MMDPKLQAIIEQVKVDILTPTQEADNETRLREVSRSFVTDTITAPTKAMYEYAVRASIGDAVFNEPCTSAFENHIAQLTGRKPHYFHINEYEAGGAAMHSGAYPIPVSSSNGHHLTLEDVKAKVVLESDIHVAPTRLICLENTLNGMIFPQNDIIRISKFARENDILMHLDGARLWHVVVETEMSLSELCAPFDSVSLCLSKGLGAPVGTCLVGSVVFINKARWFRKAFGGGMRQTGILAASAAYALSHNFPQLSRVHALARRLQRGLEELGVGILCPAETCMVFFDPSTIGVEYGEVVERAATLPDPIALSGPRLVVHIQTSTEAIDAFLQLISKLRDEKMQEGFVPSTAQTLANGTTMNVYGKA
ncbi:pyridoxal phosphate-dependent transferase [Lanmaoa asiatica]|nr:pyridoxal phosphate-dependent transferase [Lanmaoa asiatica]